MFLWQKSNEDTHMYTYKYVLFQTIHPGKNPLTFCDVVAELLAFVTAAGL